MDEEIKEKEKKLPANSLVDIYFEQQQNTLNKEDKDDDTNGNGTSNRGDLGGDSREIENPDSELREESNNGESQVEGS